MGCSNSIAKSVPKEDIKTIPNEQYVCTECNLIPEIININFDEGKVKFNCSEHGLKEEKIEEYFKNEYKYLYYNYQCCSDNCIDNKIQKDNINNIFNY